ncbi:MAG TPA: potassium transporter Kup [Vicinamibacterales bacterium]|nr:potassium transporter Kup [Vicinamibacterales bacterium]
MSTSGRRPLLPLTLTAVGVVYGDIGTSPLYALRECFFGTHAVPPTHENVLGVLSLIIYSLVLVISIKYMALVLRADNKGEGGILSLTSLLPRRGSGAPVGLVLLGLFGAALLYGDGMITPAITVLGAIEGITVATPVFEPYVVPVSVFILIVVFSVQQYGTHRIGRMYGPIMVVWFVVLAVLGLTWIVRQPVVLGAINPVHAIAFFRENGLHSIAVLGAVFLVVTGGESLYADLGHFGRRPIRIAWFTLVLPSLLLNYFGQGALLLTDGEMAEQPFFMLAPVWARLPLVALATAAAIIASQALISGAFSLTRAAIQLGYAPRLNVEHTSSWEMGQVYVPQVNWFLAISCVLIVMAFQSSAALAAAYGIAVALTMLITGTLLPIVGRMRWRWPVPAVVAFVLVFIVIDLSYVAGNAFKILDGGWLPLVIAAVIFTFMTTWKTGRRLVAERLTARAFPLEDFVAAVVANPPTRVDGTAVFMTAQPTGTPAALAHNLRYNKILHEHVIVLTALTIPVPYTTPEERLTVQRLGHGLYHARVQYGFMDDPDIPEALMQIKALGVPIDPADVTYFLGRETIVVSDRPGMAKWREKLFVLMARNAVRATAFFKLPPERVVELGVQVEM